MPNLDFLTNLKERLENRGVHTGLNQTSNSFKMAAYLVGPLILLWFALQIFLPREMASLLQGVVFGGWFVYIIVFYAFKKAAASEYIAFPQAHFRFPDGQQISYDVLVTPKSGDQKGWELITEYEDGSCLYRVNFKDKLMYQDPDRPYPDVFDYALWKTPAQWNDSFNRNGLGEFFYEGLFVTHPTCENIDVAVVDWDERGSSRVPVCLITGCSYYYKQVLTAQGKELPKAEMDKVERAEAKNADLKITISKTDRRNQYLEEELERHDKEEPAIIRERVDKEVDALLKENSDINDLKPPLTKRIWKNMKYLAYLGFAGLAVIIILWLLGAL
jgi:hypothetical protein